MICANPDIMVERGGELIYCAGALAADYAAKGGKVIYAGKPHAPDLRAHACANRAPQGPRRSRNDKILCIGDGVETDLRGRP